MTAQLCHVRNPLAPAVGLRVYADIAGLTVSEAIEAAGWRIPATTVLVRNNALVKRTDFDAETIRDGEMITLVTLPQGKGTSQIFAVIASLVLAVFAPMASAAILGEAFGTVAFAGVTWGTIGTAMIMIGGQMLISTLLPKPKAISTGESPSPTYSLSAQGNRARLGEAIPEWFGRNQIFPDLAAAPYFDYASNEQELFELFCIGQGEFAIEEMRIGDNAFWKNGVYTGTYPEILIEIIPPGSQVTLFPDNVVSSTDVSNIELIGTNETDYGWSGPFVVCPAGAKTSQIAVDILISGSYTSATVQYTFQAQAIDNTGTAIGDWFELTAGTFSITQTSTSRRTLNFSMTTQGRYQVRGKRTNAKSSDGNVTDTLSWGSMRAYLPSVYNYPGMTLVAVKARATKNLNGQNADKFNVIATRKLPIYDPATKAWSALTATRDIAPAVAHMLRSSNGAGVVDNGIALDQLWSLQETWTARGDKFDGGFDTQKGFWNCLQSVLQVGRTIPLIAAPKIVFVRDEQKTVYSAGFSALNMQPGSFNIDYIFKDDSGVDALLGTFIDERTWKSNTVLAKLPDSDATAETATPVQFFGGVQRAHVWRELMHLVAVNRYRRRFPHFNTEQEGAVCLKGSLVKVGHWLTRWGTAADVLDLVQHNDGDVLTLSEPWFPPVGEETLQRLITITTPDGRLYGPVSFDVVDAGAVSRQALVRLTSTAALTVGSYAGLQPRAWPIWTGDGLQLERPKAFFGTVEEQPQDCLIVNMKPDRGDMTAITAVIDDPRVYTADMGNPPVEVDAPDAEPNTPPVITNIAISETRSGDIVHTTVTISGTIYASSYEYRLKAVSDTEWGSIVTGLSWTFSFDHIACALVLQVRAQSTSGPGDWVEKRFIADGNATEPEPGVVSYLNIARGSVVLGTPTTITWSRAADALWYHLQIWNVHDYYYPDKKVRDIITDSLTYTYTAAEEVADNADYPVGRKSDGSFYKFVIYLSCINNWGEGGDAFTQS